MLSIEHSVADLVSLDRLASEHRLSACWPVETGEGADFVREELLRPLVSSFPLGQVRIDLALGGDFKGSHWEACSGHIVGRFQQDLFGIPATDRVVHMRFGRFQRIEAGGVVETILLFDLPSLMMQAGAWPLARPLGPHLMAPPPRLRSAMAAHDSLALVESMIAGLMRYDGKNLASMGMRSFWSDDFLWYGPAPIGSFQGHEDYERGHQGPFLKAFPDRVGGNHRSRIAERDLVASTGWPSIRATHSGGDWLGLAATGKRIEMRVMDFWRAEGVRLVENWVMIDIPHLLLQLGVDPFARMHALGGGSHG